MIRWLTPPIERTDTAKVAARRSPTHHWGRDQIASRILIGSEK